MSIRDNIGSTYAIIEGVAVKVPGVEELHSLALALGPRATISDGREEAEDRSRENKESDSCNAVNGRVLTNTDTRNTSSNKVEELAESDNRKVECGEVMMKEELALHEIEREVVEGPAENRGTNLVIKSLESSVGVVIATSLPAEDGNTLEQGPDSNGDGGRPPYDRVSEEVYLGVVLTPEVDTSAEDRP